MTSIAGPRPVASVVIATRDDRDNLADCLESLAALEFDRDALEVVVVDDGSRDGSAEMVRRDRPEVRLVAADGRGAELARNLGVDASRAEVVAFVDSDCVVPPSWLNALLARLGDDRMRVVGGPVVHRGSFWRRLTGIADFGEFQASSLHEAATLPSCNMGLYRELFDRVRFDPRMAPNADTLLAAGLRRLGATLLFDPEVRVEHRPAADWPRLMSRARRYGRSFVEARRIDPQLRYAAFVRAGVPGVVAATLGRAALDWARLLRHRRAAGFRRVEVPAAMAVLLLRRLISLPEAVRATLEPRPRGTHHGGTAVTESHGAPARPEPPAGSRSA